MPGSLPPVRGTAPALYPLNRGLNLDVAIVRFMNGAEQRWKRHAPLNSFGLHYARLNFTDASALNTFLTGTAQGMFNSTWSITLGADTYNNLGLDTDTWTIRNDRRYSLELKCSQTQNAPTIPALVGSYPLMTSGAVCSYPYDNSPQEKTLCGKNPNGPRYATGYYGFGLAGYPTDALNNLTLAYTNVSDADLATYIDWFLAAGGAWSTFAYADPTGPDVIPKCRFDQASLDITYLQKNASSFSVKLAQVP
jgi:hypothetical protein